MQLAAIAISGPLDGVVLWALIRIVAGVRIPLRHSVIGILLGMLALAVLRTVGAQLLVGSGGLARVLLTSVAVMAGLMLWINLASRVMLFTAAWIAETAWWGEHAPQQIERGSPSVAETPSVAEAPATG